MSLDRPANRRDQLLDTATRLFVSNGFHATTMDQLAEAVRLNKGTLYHYFPSKAQILYEILITLNQNSLAYLVRNGLTRSEVLRLPPDDALRQYIVGTVVFIAAHPIESQLASQEAPFLAKHLSPVQQKHLRTTQVDIETFGYEPVRRGIEQGLFKDVNPQVATESIRGMLTWLVRWYKKSGSLTPEQIGTDLGDIILGGLLASSKVPGAPSPRRQIDLSSGRAISTED